MTAIKKLKYIKKNALNIILFIFTLSLTWFIPVFNSINRILAKKDAYTAQQYAIVDFHYTSTANSHSSTGIELIGFINNKRTLILVDPDYNFKIGDTVYVWYDGIKYSRERYPNETHSDFVKRFEKSRNNIIIFVFTPYILLWLIVILLRIKKRKLKIKKNEI